MIVAAGTKSTVDSHFSANLPFCHLSELTTAAAVATFQVCSNTFLIFLSSLMSQLTAIACIAMQMLELHKYISHFLFLKNVGVDYGIWRS